MGKIAALWNLFRVGQAVEDPAKWKNRQITVTALAPVLLALVHVARAWGLPIDFSDDDAAMVAGAVLVLVNLVLTPLTSTKVGLPAANGARVDGGTVAPSATRSDEASAPEGAHPSQLPNGSQASPVDPFDDSHGA